MPDLLFEMHTGVSGDMILGALMDAGLDFEVWKDKLQRSGLPKADITREKVHTMGIHATRVSIAAPEEAKHRSLSDITIIIKNGAFSEITEKRALEIFSNLAQAEAKVHGCEIQAVKFHEVGGIDTIVDIVGACLGFEMLDIRGFFTTPFTFGNGEIETEHGKLPVPVPATMELTKNFPARRTAYQGELCTPTGAAVLTTLAIPETDLAVYMTTKTGYGAGTREIKGVPNVLRLSIIERTGQKDEVFPNQEIFQVECNLDDLSPEILGYLTQELLRKGCHDVWQESIYMKKNRAGSKLCCLVSSKLLKDILSLIIRETSTGGIRYYPVKRIISEKSLESVKTRYGEIALKKSQFTKDLGNIIRLTPEYQSCKMIAQQHNIPLQQVFLEAISQLHKEDG